MKTLFIIVFFFSVYFMNAQSITLDDVNSKNIMELLTDHPKNKDQYHSKSEVTQIGDKNTVEVYNKSKQSNIQLSQLGSFNTTYFINPNVNSKPETKINVSGHNNHIDITGSNSISEKLIINLKTDDKMIFMRNY